MDNIIHIFVNHHENLKKKYFASNQSNNEIRIQLLVCVCERERARALESGATLTGLNLCKNLQPSLFVSNKPKNTFP